MASWGGHVIHLQARIAEAGRHQASCRAPLQGERLQALTLGQGGAEGLKDTARIAALQVQIASQCLVTSK